METSGKARIRDARVTIIVPVLTLLVVAVLIPSTAAVSAVARQQPDISDSPLHAQSAFQQVLKYFNGDRHDDEGSQHHDNSSSSSNSSSKMSNSSVDYEKGEEEMPLLGKMEVARFVRQVFRNVGCQADCQCLNVSWLPSSTLNTSLPSLDQASYHRLSVTLLYLITNHDALDAICRANDSDLDLPYHSYLRWLLDPSAAVDSLVPPAESAFVTRLQQLLNVLRSKYDPEMDDDDKDDHSDGEDDHGDGEDDHGDEEDDHEEDDHGDGEDDHGDEEDDHEEDDHGDEEDGDDHSHKEDGQNKCFDIHTLTDVADLDPRSSKSLPTEKAENMAGWLVWYLFSGRRLQTSCTGLPLEQDFLHDLYEHVGLARNQPMDMAAFEKLLVELKLGTVADHDEEEGDDHDAHAHDSRKRRSVTRQTDRHRSRRQVTSTEATPEETSIINKCFSGDTLVDIYRVNMRVGITQVDFERLCPALIQQYVSKSCDQIIMTTPEVQQNSTNLEIYGYGSLAVLIISLASLLGVVFVSCASSTAYHYLLSLMVALAVGTLTGDAILHLIPETFGLHGHGEEEADGHGQEAEAGGGLEVHFEPYMAKGLAILASIYVFFIMQTLLEWCRGHHHHHTAHEAGHNFAEVQGQLHSGIHQTDQEKAGKEPEETNHPPMDEGYTVQHGQGCGGTKSVAWMVILGDAIHNVADGLAIGAAFSLDVRGGISTSLAVLCHEIPHELGDFAVLLKSGMSVKRAAMFNFVSAILAFIGLYIGISLGNNQEAREWIFAIAAGMFLYVALADMVPELMEQQAEGSRWLVFLLQNVGLLLGFGILIIIALFEENIKV